MNLVAIIGNLGATPRIFVTEKGTSIANFPVYVNETYKDKQTGAMVTRKTVIPCVMFNHTSLLPYLESGTHVAVEGSWRNNNYEDKTGKMVYGHQMVVQSVKLLDRKKNDDGGNNENNSQPEVADDEGVFQDDDIPF